MAAVAAVAAAWRRLPKAVEEAVAAYTLHPAVAAYTLHSAVAAAGANLTSDSLLTPPLRRLTRAQNCE